MSSMTLVYQRRRDDATRRLKARFHVLTYTKRAGFVLNEKMPSIVFNKGHLMVGNTPIHTANFSPDHVTWVQQAPGRYSSGHLFVQHDGLGVHGVIYHGTSPGDAAIYHIAGTSIKPFTYKTTITKSAYPTSTDPSTIPDSDWQDGLNLEISYQLEIGESSPTPKVCLDGQDITMQTTWFIDSKGRTVLTIALDDGICALADQLYKTATLAFDMYIPVPVGSGSVSAMCNGGSTTDKVFFWKAKPLPQMELFASPEVENIQSADVVAVADDLTITELMTILPDQAVNDDCNSMLIRNMKWAMGQDSTEKGWLHDFFGELPPSIDDSGQQKLVQQSLSWYQNEFAKAYLTQSFNLYDGPNAPSHRLDSDQAKKLDTYLKDGLAQSKDFNIQHQGIFVDAFIGTKPRLHDYINDGGEKWANQLFKVLTAGPQFILMVNRVSGAAGDPQALGPLNNFACLLTALQPSAELAKAYYQSVMTGVIVKLIPQTAQTDRNTILQWLPAAMQEMLRKLADGELPSEVDISKAEGEEMYQEYLKHQSEITSAMADLLQSISASGLIKQTQQFEQGFETIAQKYPKLAKAGKLFFVIGWIGGLSSIIVALTKGDWSKMTDVEKAQFVTECVQSVVQAFDAVPLLYNGIKNLTIDAWNRLTARVNAPDQQIEMQNLGERLLPEDEEWVVVSAEELQPIINAGGVLGRGTLYARLFGEGILAGCLKILGAVTAAAMAGWSLWQLIEDVKNHGSVSTIVFDSLIFAANFLSAVCLVVDLFVATSFLPILGAVLAIAGIIIGILAGFFEKPKNPVDDFMKDVGIPFANQLPAPPSTLAARAIQPAFALVPV